MKKIRLGARGQRKVKTGCRTCKYVRPQAEPHTPMEVRLIQLESGTRNVTKLDLLALPAGAPDGAATSPTNHGGIV